MAKKESDNAPAKTRSQSEETTAKGDQDLEEQEETHVQMTLDKTVSVRGHTFFAGQAQVPVKLVDAVTEENERQGRIKRQAEDEPLHSKKEE